MRVLLVYVILIHVKAPQARMGDGAGIGRQWFPNEGSTCQLYKYAHLSCTRVAVTAYGAVRVAWL